MTAEQRILLRKLEARVKGQPDDATAWRLLGHARMQSSDWTGALAALEQAIRLDSLSVAAFFDYGQVAAEHGDQEMAAAALQRVVELAPDSDYATQAQSLHQQLLDSGVIEQARYELRTFDGSNIESQITDDEQTSWWKGFVDDLNLRLDLGSQYNSNVSLAPSSRELAGGDNLDSAQATASLYAKWLCINTPDWRAGFTFDGDFTVNEGQFDRFNLQSYRPGAFVDRLFTVGSVRLRPRLSYAFDYDEFGNQRFGQKHSMSTSLSTIWSRRHVSTLYYSVDVNDLTRDGANPRVTSQDGVSNTVGVIHDLIQKDSLLRNVRVGTDFSHAETDGSTYRYNGVSVYSQAVIMLLPQVQWTVRGGWAFRDYPDFTQAPSRNTHIWRAGTEVRKYFDHGVSVAAFANYDDFASRNDRFNTDRFLTGGVLTWEY